MKTVFIGIAIFIVLLLGYLTSYYYRTFRKDNSRGKAFILALGTAILDLGPLNK